MKNFLLILIFSATLIISCKPEEEILTSDFVNLVFKNDSNKITKSILFDTVLAGKNGVFKLPSISKRLKVINPNRKAVKTSISLSVPDNSSYFLYINGKKTTSENDILLRGNDSMYVLVQVIPSLSNTSLPFLVNDSIKFITNFNTQFINLIAYGRDAVYYKNKIISENTTWDSTKIRFLYNTVIVASGATLTIEKGTKIYASKGSYLEIEGSLQVLGDTSNKDKVQFQGERTEKYWDTIPAQWGGINFKTNSKNNIIQNTIIKNAITGILISNSENSTFFPDLKITNSIIKNMSNKGIYAFHASITGWNILMYNCVNELLSVENGGFYHFFNNTFANNSFNFNRTTSAIYLSDGNNNLNSNPIEINFINNIIWGERQIEYITQKVNAANWTITFENNAIKTDDISLRTNGNITSTTVDDIKFKNTENLQNADFGIKIESIGKEKGVSIPFIFYDLKNKIRPILSDIGAYQH